MKSVYVHVRETEGCLRRLPFIFLLYHEVGIINEALYVSSRF